MSETIEYVGKNSLERYDTKIKEHVSNKLPIINGRKDYSSTFYTATSEGTGGYLLMSNGSFSAPIWISQSGIIAGKAVQLENGRIITIGNFEQTFDGTTDINYTLDEIGAVNKAGDIMSGNLTITNNSPVFTIQNIDGGTVSLVFDRNLNGSWQIINDGGKLKFQCDYTTEKTDYFDVLILNYSNRNASFLGTFTATGGFSGNLSGNATTATTATKLGSTTIGGDTTPIYLSSGTAKACSGRTVPGIKTATAATTLGYGTNNDYVANIAMLSYWNGAYTGTTSNLAYCNKGAFGTIVTKSTSDYLAIAGGTVTGATKFSGALTFTDYGGGVRRPVSSDGTDGNRVSWMQSNVRSSDTTYYLKINGQYGSTSAYTGYNYLSTTSDIRLKTNIKQSQVLALPVLNEIQICEFDWIAGSHQKIGFVADYLEQQDPSFAVGGGYDEDGNMDVKSVNSLYLLGYVVKGIQELYSNSSTVEKTVNDHEERILKLEKENEELKKELALLKVSA